ncbi:MAG: clostripain-related cysteine peptidase [Ruminococcus sp.]
MNYKLKLTAIAVVCAMTAGFAAGCSEKNTVNPSKGLYEESQNTEETAEAGSYDGIVNNIESNGETGKVYSQTIMVYMVGSDLESRYGAATADLAEMEKALPDSGENNIVVCAGGASAWQNSVISEDEQTLLHLENGAFKVVDTLDARNMGEAENLSSFIAQCMEHYDTDMYSLILWDHGAGPVLGYGVDENYNDILSLSEMQAALENSVGKTGKKLEWIGFDACLMSSLEICDAFEPYANYLISSQETEPGWGWNYEFLSSLSEPDMDGAHLGKEIIDTYMEYGEMIFEAKPSSYSDLTLSCLNLSEYGHVEETFNEFFAEAHEALSTETFPQTVRDRNKVKEFGSFSASFNYSLADAVDLVNKIASDDSDTEDAVIEAINKMTVYMRTNVENANGVSVCYPYNADDNYSEYCIKLDDAIGFADNYVKFLNDFYAIRDGETIADEWNVSDAQGSVHDVASPDPEPVEEKTEESSEEEPTEEATEETTEAATEAAISAGTSSVDICLQLTPEQKANFGSATYYILCKAEESGLAPDDERKDDMYIFVHGGKNVKMDNAGVLHAYYSNNVVYMKDETEGKLSEIPMVLIDNDSSSKEKRYTGFAVLTYAADDIADWDVQAANLQIVVDSAHPNGEIRSAVPILADDEVQRASKQLLSLDDYTYMSVTGTCNYITRDENGNLLPFFDWEKSGWQIGFEQDLQNEYSLEVTSIKNPENYFCMFVVTDSQGNASVSELIPLK